MYMDALVSKLDNYEIAVGDKIYVLTYPNSSNSKYTYKEATIIRIAKNTHIHEKPSEHTKHYKAKLKMYEDWLNKDECDRCKFTINCKGDNYSREISRKYLYTQNEFDILIKDIENLNHVYSFKKEQEQEFNRYLKETFQDWDYYNFEEQRKLKKKEVDI